MKYKYFLQLYGSYYLIIISTFLLSSDLIYIPFLWIYYFFLLKEYNRVGFISIRMKYLLILYGVTLFVLLGVKSYVFYLQILMTFSVLLIHIPHRKKVRSFLKEFTINHPIKVFNNRFEVEDTIYNFDFQLKEREVLWLSKQILLKSKSLSCMNIEFINNEFLGNHFYVNIS